MDNFFSSTEPTLKLREAIRKLQAYSLYQSEISNASSISKTISLVRSILLSPFHPLAKRGRFSNRPNKNEILVAVELINQNRFFIEKLKEGTDAERQLAEELSKTINAYNENYDKRHMNVHAKKHLIENFFLDNSLNELPKIAIPKKITVQHHYPEHTRTKKVEKLSLKTEIPLPKQYAELFQMKAIALLERYGIASNPEARPFVKESPIYAAVDENSSICTLSQTLSLFPGQTIVVKGHSSLDPKTQAISQLFPETFCLFLESTQTGFPHPLQRAGWSVASQILPDFPQRADLLKEVGSLLQRKNQTIFQLMPQGNLIKPAKELLSIKKQIFNHNSSYFLNLHKKLGLLLLKGENQNLKGSHPKIHEEKIESEEKIKIIHQFYEFLETQHHSYEFLAETSHLIREHFIAKPHQLLLKEIMSGKMVDLGNSSPESRYHSAKILLDQAFSTCRHEIFEKKMETTEKHSPIRIKWEYMKIMGNILGEASKSIILQYLSEDLVFPPPTLTSFESQLQAIAFNHLKDFLNELSLPLQGEAYKDPTFIFEMLENALCSDISHFENDSFPPPSKELASYFEKRFLSLQSIH